MLVMSEPVKKKRGRKGKPNRNGRSIQVWLPHSLYDALDAQLAESRRSITAEVTIALENHLKQSGLWPPAGDGEA